MILHKSLVSNLVNIESTKDIYCLGVKQCSS